jgi:hypothetical protein
VYRASNESSEERRIELELSGVVRTPPDICRGYGPVSQVLRKSCITRSHVVCSVTEMSDELFPVEPLTGLPPTFKTELEQLQERRAALYQQSQELTAELQALSRRIDAMLAELAEKQPTPEEILAKNPLVD